jgi:hypothetical protein
MPTSSDAYRRNHYVPQWYQHRFIPATAKERKFYYLDLQPEFVVSNGRRHLRAAVLHWGPSRCFYQSDLYTTRFGGWESTDIEHYFFGEIDRAGNEAVQYFESFSHPGADGDAFHALLRYMSTQKLRTPKGLAFLASIGKSDDRSVVLEYMQALQNIFCAHWTESVWSIAEGDERAPGFIITDHPVTVYNEGCFPASKWCQGFNDPDIRMNGTHTLFPLSPRKVLILTNLSWVRNPYASPLHVRPNPNPFRGAMFNFTQIQTGRVLTTEEVLEVNLILKSRAHRYLAAVEKEWLYPERTIKTRWDKLGRGYLLMPDPRSVTFTTGLVIGYKGGRGEAFDEYGHRPGEAGYEDKARRADETRTFYAFQGEFARVFGPRRRGHSFSLGEKTKDEDSADFHAYHLRLEGKFKPPNSRKRGP